MTENDTIYRQAAIDIIQKERHEAWENLKDDDPEYRNGFDDGLAESIRILIDDLPSAQPEIVRCKDCKWFGDIGCAISIADDSDKPTENDFCSFAERRSDE